MLRKITSLLALLFLLTQATRASHIAGAEITYRCTGGDNYHFSITVYRDCLSGTASYDNLIDIFIFYGATGALYSTETAPVPFSTPEIVPENLDACVAVPPDICVEVGVYEFDVYLPPVAGGYDVGWARCCRNYTIVNLDNPRCEGITVTAHVPGPEDAICNSMPTFNNTPPIFLCAGQPFAFDYSATDIDGDSLVYEVVNPYTGTNFAGLGVGNPGSPCPSTNDPVLDPVSNPMGPPTYRNVLFAAGHSYTNPFGPGGYLNIDPNTGYLTLLPINIGIHVLAIGVKEYRDGKFLSEMRRDFQFHVIECIPQGPPPIVTHDFGSIPSSGDTIWVEAGRPFCYDFTIEDTVLPSYVTADPISYIFGGNPGFPGPYATISLTDHNPPSTGQICWVPACEYIGDTLEVILSVRDTNDCPNYNIVFDTVWIIVQPAPNVPPHTYNMLSTITGGVTVVGDTVFADPNQVFCYEFLVIDTLGGASLTAYTELRDMFGTWLPPMHTTTLSVTGDTLTGRICFNPGCAVGARLMLITRGIDMYQCPPENESRDTAYIVISVPPNPPPTVDISSLGSPMVGDTFQVNVFDTICFDFVVTDTSVSGNDSLYYSWSIEALDGPFGGVGPIASGTYTGTVVIGDICWRPACVHVDRLFRVIVNGTQVNECARDSSVSDTIYVRVNEPVKPPPVFIKDLGPSSPDNYNAFIQDNDTLCFSFSLQDTFTPTFLTLATDVTMEDGSPYTGPAPTITILTSLDTLITGTVCWTVPCELANQTFMLHLQGRDTFDCDVSNLVLDSVRVTHVENPPMPTGMCAVSVESGDASIRVTWQLSAVDDAIAYIIQRQPQGAGAWSTVDTVYGLGTLSYVDASGVTPDAGSWCYRVAVMDRCGTVSAFSEEVCTFFLSGQQTEYIVDLDWTPYTDFPNGVQTYEVWRRDQGAAYPGEMYNDNGATTRYFRDDDIHIPRPCYRIRAIELDPGCGYESWSNEVCFVMPPTLFLPNAFTPNGDGLNDFFISGGEFTETFHLEVYDRWGMLIFEAETQTEGWDGTYKGVAVSEGTYVWHVRATGYGGEQLQTQGSVLVIR